MKRNFVVLLAVSVLFGLAFGVYELALPLFLKSRGFSPVAGSLVFAVPALCAILMRLSAGHASDRLGRKGVNTFALALCGVVTNS